MDHLKPVKVYADFNTVPPLLGGESLGENWLETQCMFKVDVIMWRARTNPFDTLTISATSLMVTQNSSNFLDIFSGYCR